MEKMKRNNLNAYKYHVEMVSFGDDDYEYMVTFEQFKEVIGAGSTEEEAIKDAKDNLGAFFEYCEQNGIAIPEPLSKKWIDDYSGKITVRLPKQLHRDISIYASRDGVSLNYIINDAIRAYLNESSINDVVNSAVSELNEASYYLICDFENWYDYSSKKGTFGFSNYCSAPKNQQLRLKN